MNIKLFAGSADRVLLRYIEMESRSWHSRPNNNGNNNPNTFFIISNYCSVIIKFDAAQPQIRLADRRHKKRSDRVCIMFMYPSNQEWRPNEKIFSSFGFSLRWSQIIIMRADTQWRSPRVAVVSLEWCIDDRQRQTSVYVHLIERKHSLTIDSLVSIKRRRRWQRGFVTESPFSILPHLKQPEKSVLIQRTFCMTILNRIDMSVWTEKCGCAPLAKIPPSRCFIANGMATKLIGSQIPMEQTMGGFLWTRVPP